MPLQTLPLRIGQIIWINGTHPFNLSHEFLLPFPENGQKLFPNNRCPFAKHALRHALHLLKGSCEMSSAMEPTTCPPCCSSI